ncbi:efflux RND transporter periplasmic adaptor subunit [Affinirhizobium pseudoryzae]|uniref:efflux RND transporter periplasmic adaptor subunit n=1 Tax=Allorhizobium pseudoryzae TaxID=379684 RepID=UPI001F40F53E|nr:efflux RND transporter periplasmic adaptor subunit [Allorhizobium pseudoryzae]
MPMITRQTTLVTLIAAIALSGGVALPVAAQDQKAAAPAQAEPARLPAIVVTRVVARPLVDSVVASGTVRPVQEIFVQPLVDGLSIKVLHADVGDRVKAGDVVAELNSDSLLLQKSQLQANKAKAEAGLAQYRAQVIEAQANADDAVRQRDRAVTLSRNGTVSTSQVEQLTASADAALARLNAARQAVSVGEADIKVVDAQIDDIDLKLERTEVKAPVDGIISVRDAKVGAIASGAGTPLFTMIRNGEIELVADVPESDIRRIKAGMPARVTIAGGRDPLPGKVRLVAPVVDASTRLGSVHIVVDASTGAKAGMYASAQIIIEETTALSLPQSAVTTERGGTIARQVENHVIKQVAVETGIQDKGYVQILSGLAEGDMVVAKAGAFVRDGDRISPVSDEPAAASN